MAVLMQYICEKKPHIVVLENVKNFPEKHANVFKRLLRYLEGLGLYHVFHEVLNTLDYGVPQHRQRLYVVLIKKRLLRLQFKWPEPTPCKPLSSCWDRDGKHQVKRARSIDPQLLHTATTGENLVKSFKSIKKRHGKPSMVDAVIDIGCSAKFSTYKIGVAPTLTATRCRSHGYFSTSLMRPLSTTEMMRLQGADPNKLDMDGTSHAALGHMAGNAMSINVLSAVIRQALASTSLPAQSQFIEESDCSSG